MDKKPGIKEELFSALKEISTQNNSLSPKALTEKDLCTLLLSALLEEER